MEIFDTLGSVLGDAGSWLGRNEDWVKPVASTAFNLYSNSRANSARQDYASLAREAEQRNYDDFMRNYSAYTDYLGQKAGADASNAAARNAAAAANERARLKGVKESKKIMTSQLGKAEDALRPYYQMGLDVIPAVKDTYLGGVRGLGSLTQTMLSPEMAARMNMSTPASAVNLAVPEYMRLR